MRNHEISENTCISFGRRTQLIYAFTSLILDSIKILLNQHFVTGKSTKLEKISSLMKYQFIVRIDATGCELTRFLVHFVSHFPA